MKIIKEILKDIRNYIKYSGNNHICPLCSHKLKYFTPGLAHDGQKTIEKYRIISMGARKNYRCPFCNSSDKERLVWLFLRDKISPEMKILHIAPEKNTKRLLSRMVIDYISGDKFEGDERYNKNRYGDDSMYLDVTKLPFGDDSFDIVICNHVLEHIEEDMAAIREIKRVLRPGKFAVLQVPVSRDIKNTIENKLATSPEERLNQFGQRDHIRIYSEKNYIERLEKSGFRVEVVKYNQVIKDSNFYGINPKESIYLGFK